MVSRARLKTNGCRKGNAITTSPHAQKKRPARADRLHSTGVAGSFHTGTGSRFLKECRARLSRLFTVPTGIPMASAISS